MLAMVSSRAIFAFHCGLDLGEQFELLILVRDDRHRQLPSQPEPRIVIP